MLSDLSELRKIAPAYVQSRAFTIQIQVIDKTSSKNIHLQGRLENLVPRSGGKMSFPFLILGSHYTVFTDQKPLWCSIITCLLTQHPERMGAIIPNSIWLLQTTKYCYSCQRTGRTPVTSFCYFHSTMVRPSYSFPIFILMAESLPAAKERAQH